MSRLVQSPGASSHSYPAPPPCGDSSSFDCSPHAPRCWLAPWHLPRETGQGSYRERQVCSGLRARCSPGPTVLGVASLARASSRRPGNDHGESLAISARLLLQSWGRPLPRGPDLSGRTCTGVTAPGLVTRVLQRPSHTLLSIPSTADRTGTRTGPAAAPEPTPPHGHDHPPTKTQPHWHGQSRALPWGEGGHPGAAQGEHGGQTCRMVGAAGWGGNDVRVGRQAQQGWAGRRPPCSAHCWQRRAGGCRRPGPWCSPLRPRPAAAWRRRSSRGYMPRAAPSSLETDT